MMLYDLLTQSPFFLHFVIFFLILDDGQSLKKKEIVADNKSAEYNVANLLAQKMFRNYNSSPLRQHTANRSFFVFYQV